MGKDTEQSAVGRRKFLKAATLAGTGAIAAGAAAVGAQAVAAETAPAAAGAATRKSSLQITSRDSEHSPPPPNLEGATHTTCGSDFMVDVMRNLGIEYVAAIPGNTFKGLPCRSMHLPAT